MPRRSLGEPSHCAVSSPPTGDDTSATRCATSYLTESAITAATRSATPVSDTNCDKNSSRSDRASFGSTRGVGVGVVVGGNTGGSHRSELVGVVAAVGEAGKRRRRLRVGDAHDPICVVHGEGRADTVGRALRGEVRVRVVAEGGLMAQPVGDRLESSRVVVAAGDGPGGTGVGDGRELAFGVVAIAHGLVRAVRGAPHATQPVPGPR